jgi:pimeloyl-ACP methyl ester carboxylesterase
MGLTDPIDVAGNSLGGTMALEAARRGLARSVVAISPAGLWKKGGARYVPLVFAMLRYGATRFPRLLEGTLRQPLLRELALAVPISIGSRRMNAIDAVGAVKDLGRAEAFEATFNSTRSTFSGTDITAPTTIAFGTRDWILPEGSRCRNLLPRHTTWIVKRGWGHVPMWLDPEGVAQLILSGTA